VLLAIAWLSLSRFTWRRGPGPVHWARTFCRLFWATFVAAYFYGARVGLLVGLFAPAINLLVTGLPAWKFLSVMSFELAIFAIVTAWAVKRLPRLILSAPLGYIVAKIASTGVQAATPVFGDIGQPVDFFVRSLTGGIAGLVVLAAINAALVWFIPKTRVRRNESFALRGHCEAIVRMDLSHGN